jgi:PTH1 family peptidyl-tRNA hydrolase
VAQLELMRLMVGLGNPGPEYAKTRHNVGFQVADELARRWGLEFRRGKWKSLVAAGSAHGQSVVLLKPQTFMNDSGQAVGGAAQFYKAEPADVLVVYDDIDLPLGKLRLREQGSHGGHNGVRSIIQHLHSMAFPRLKVGVGRPARGDPADHVLTGFRKHELPIVEELIPRAADAVETALRDGVIAAMNQFNGEPPI